MSKEVVEEAVDSKKFIYIKGARVHNLKNIDVVIPKNKLVVITGLSGSGKSSLAFDTLFAEGQRRYVESLSAYARQFLGKLEKPEVDYIKGIAPAIAIEQKVNSRNPRSTVGTSTEIYDYLKLLYTRIGKTYSPISGRQVAKDYPADIVQKLLKLQMGTRVFICAPITYKLKNIQERLQSLSLQGFNRLFIDNQIVNFEDFDFSAYPQSTVLVLIDRLTIQLEDDELQSRLFDSIQTAYNEGIEQCVVITDQDGKRQEFHFNNKFEADGIVFEEPSDYFFSFNNPIGACKVCEGFGSVIGIDEDLVIPNKNLSVYEDAIICWKGEKMSEWKNAFIKQAHKFDFPIHRPFYDLSQSEKDLLWNGNKYFSGLNEFFKYLESESYKIQYRVMLSRYRGKTVCRECQGTRLRKDASYVKIDGKSIQDIVLMSISESLQHFQTIQLSDHDAKVAKRLLTEIVTRLTFLENVGLGYLTLNRLSNSLSGGESQRINLATNLGSSLVGSMYILDEPSIGLHSRDTEKLIKVLFALRDIGNSVIVVEHDEDIIAKADYLIDIGPEAGSNGGKVVYQGKLEHLSTAAHSLTAQYLSRKKEIPVPKHQRVWKYKISLEGIRENNLKNITVHFPLNVFTVITGVSGSGKSSLVKRVLYPALKKQFGGYGEKTGTFDKLYGNTERIKDVEFIDQNPIGKSSRSNPVTYVKAYDEIRDLFASQKLAKVRGYKAGHFSFNVAGGRCDACEGEGVVKIEMQFMADVFLTCDSCNGHRFKDEVLEIKYHDKNISDILNLTIDEAIDFFQSKENTNNESKIVEKLKPLQDVGLGYVKMGQSSNTLSGGEAQRIKLASFLTKGKQADPVLFIFDEPTTGLHFHDVNKLLKSFDALLENGHSIIVIEHNLEVVKCADWIIDIGPEGGKEGGNIVFEGTPKQLIAHNKGYTSKYLAEKMRIV